MIEFICFERLEGRSRCGCLVRVLPRPLEAQSTAILAEAGDDADEAPGAALGAGAHRTVLELAVVLLEAAKRVCCVADVVISGAEGIE